MTKTIKFSIIIPVLNEERYIPQILKSLQKQAYKDFEVIVVNDNSTDKTLKKIGNIQKQVKFPIKLSSNKKRMGISYSRNRGAKAARGEFLIFFDADGIISPNWLEVADEYFKDHPTAKAIGGKTIFINKNLPLHKFILYNSHPFISYLFAFLFQLITGNANYIIGNNMAIKKEAFFKAGMFPDLICEDVFFTSKLRKLFPKRNSLKFYPKLLVHYSARHFEKNGYFKTLIEWINAYLVKHRSHKSYKIYR